MTDSRGHRRTYYFEPMRLDLSLSMKELPFAVDIASRVLCGVVFTVLGGEGLQPFAVDIASGVLCGVVFTVLGGEAALVSGWRLGMKIGSSDCGPRPQQHLAPAPFLMQS